jgi:Holliday junction resolvasome RuvABC endonuclease subunit
MEALEQSAKHTVLSLDLGSSTGWCLGQNNVIEYSGVKSFYIKDSHPGLRFKKFYNWLLKFRNVDEIFVEDVVQRFLSMHSARVYCGLLAMLQVFCITHSIRLTGIKPSAVKLAFTGRGGAKKAEMCNAAIKLGWANGKLDTETNNDEADACAIYYAVMKKRGYDVTFSNK